MQCECQTPTDAVQTLCMWVHIRTVLSVYVTCFCVNCMPELWYAVTVYFFAGSNLTAWQNQPQVLRYKVSHNSVNWKWHPLAMADLIWNIVSCDFSQVFLQIQKIACTFLYPLGKFSYCGTEIDWFFSSSASIVIWVRTLNFFVLTKALPCVILSFINKYFALWLLFSKKKKKKKQQPCLISSNYNCGLNYCCLKSLTIIRMA